jgi:hypothetical protein
MLLNSDLSFDDKKSSISLKIEVNSYADKININKLKKFKKSSKKTIYDIILTILTSYAVADPQYFISIILDSIDSDNKEIVFGSEIVNYDNNFEDGLIKSMVQFRQIILYYYTQTNDEHIFSIKWEDFIRFSGNGIDINYIHPLLLSYILDLSTEDVNSILKNRPIENISLFFDKEQVKILKDLNIKSFIPTVKCNVFIDVLDQQSNAEFIYDLSTKKVRDVVIFAKH